MHCRSRLSERSFPDSIIVRIHDPPALFCFSGSLIDKLDSESSNEQSKEVFLKFLYQSHPAENILQSVIPVNLWNARINVLPIPYSDLKSIRSVIRRLVKFINGSEPDLVLFFATGSLPYVLPAINILALNQGEVLLERTVFHMFPGLAWRGRIDGHSSEDFFISEVLLLLQQIHASSKIPKILCVDTTNTGNAVNKVLKAMRGVCNRFLQELEVNMIGIVNGVDAIATANDQISIEYGEASIAYVIRPGGIVLPDRVGV